MFAPANILPQGRDDGGDASRHACKWANVYHLALPNIKEATVTNALRIEAPFGCCRVTFISS